MNDLQELERELGPALRRTLDAMFPIDRDDVSSRAVASLDQPRTSEVDRRPLDVNVEERPPRFRTLGAAAAAVLIAGGGVLVLATRTGPGSTPATPLASSDAATNSANASEPGALPQSASSTGPTLAGLEPDDVSGIFLPGEPIRGFTLADIQVHRPLELHPDRHVAYYLRDNSGDGSDLLVLSIQPGPEADDGRDDDPGSITVHGVSAHIYDSGAGTVVQWEETGHLVEVRGVGVSWNDTAAYAERSVIADGMASIPGMEAEGFALTTDVAPPANAAETILSYQSDVGTPGLFLSIASYVNSDRRTLDVVEAEQAHTGLTAERVTVGELPALALTSPEDRFGQMVTVEWIRDGFVLSVTGRLPAEELMMIAESVRPAALATARELDALVDSSLGALPEVDRATLPNGFDVSVHNAGTGADAVCLHAPVEDCESVMTESSMGGEHQTEVAATFLVDGTTWLVGWAEGTHEPALVNAAGENVGPIPDTEQGTSGTFAAFAASEDDGLRFDPDVTRYHATGVALTHNLLDGP